jgi:hypothetical protein
VRTHALAADAVMTRRRAAGALPPPRPERRPDVGSRVHGFLWYTARRPGPRAAPARSPGRRFGPRSNMRPPAMSAGLLARSVSLVRHNLARTTPYRLMGGVSLRTIMRPMILRSRVWRLTGLLAQGSESARAGLGVEPKHCVCM